jgi:predicted aspartyl protease
MNSTVVPMVKNEDGLLTVPVQINGAITLQFVVDSGASDILIPNDVFTTLLKTGTIQQADILPGQAATLADGSTVKSGRFILHSIKVGGVSFSNVEASVGVSSSQLLLGQVFLSRFKPGFPK